MLKKILGFLLITALFACDNQGNNLDENNINNQATTSNLTVAITDAPIDSADEVNVTFTKIEIAQGEEDDAEWITYFEGSQSINLLDFQNGLAFNFPEAELALGDYGQIRLFLSAEDGDNTIVIDGETHDLAYNAGVANSGLKLVGGFSLVAGVDTTLTIDFDARKSIVVKGGNNNPSYNLKPTIKLIQEDLTGNIIISNAEADTTYYIYDSETDVTEEHLTTDENEDLLPYMNATLSAMSFTDGEDTVVKFAYVPFGTYKVYKSSYDENDVAQALTEVTIVENETETVSITAEDETEVTYTFGNDEDIAANLTVAITDAPIDSADEVNVTFTKIEIAQGEEDDAEWITYFEGSQSINLLDFQNGLAFNFPEVELALGEYGQIRLFLSAEDGDNTIVIDGETFELEYNAGVANTGLKLVGGFSLVEGVDTTITIDFDARKSIVVKGNPNNPSYNLKPTIKLIQEDLTGNIIISNAEADTTYYIYDSETDVTEEHLTTDENEDLLPYMNSILSAISYIDGEDTVVTFAYVPFGTYKVYKSSYDENDVAQPLTEVTIVENETETVSITAEDETEVTFTFE